MKIMNVLGLVFVQIAFENCVTNFYFKNGKIFMKMTIANFLTLLVWNVSVCFRIFMQLRFPVILLTSAVISRQRLLYGNEVAQYLQNCKYYNIGQDHFRKLL